MNWTCMSRARSLRRKFLRSGCKVCMLPRDITAPMLFTEEKRDGSGCTAQGILYAAALAARHGWNFGGLVSSAESHERHGVDVRSVASAFLGINVSTLLVSRGDVMPCFSREFMHKDDLDRAVIDHAVDTHAGVPSLIYVGRILSKDFGVWSEDERDRAIDGYFTPDFLSALRTQSLVSTVPLRFKPGRPSIAVHVRRGDIDKDSLVYGMPRWTDDSYYFVLADRLARHLPRADIHVFSSLEGKYNRSDFDGYKRRNMTLHLDTDEVEAWAHFARADVAIIAKSSFSYMPALLNPHCVIYQRFWNRPLRAWMEGTRPRPSVDAELRTCLARIGAARPQQT